MDSIIRKIEDAVSGMTKSQKLVAEYILNDPMQAAMSTIDQIAHTVGVSTATVVRFSTELGFSGYTDFQNNLQTFMRDKSRPSSKLSARFESSGDGRSVTAQIAKLEVDNIQRSFEGLDEAVLNEISDLILSANHLHTFGSRSSYSVASYLGYNLNRMLENGCSVNNSTGSIPETIRNLSSGDVVFVITLARYCKSAIEFAALAKKRGATVIALTDSIVSPLAEHSDYTLVGRPTAVGFHNSVTSLCFLVDAILGICCSKAPDRVRKNLQATEEILDAMDYMVRS